MLGDETGIDGLSRLLVKIADQDGIASLCYAVELLGEVEGDVDATMGGGFSGVIAAVDCHAVPCQTLHERHRRLVILSGVILDVFRQDRV